MACDKRQADAALFDELVGRTQVGDDPGFGRAVGLVQDAFAEIVDDPLLGRLGERRGVGDDRLQPLESAMPLQDGTLQRENGVEMGRHKKGSAQSFGRQPLDHPFGIESRQDFAIAAEIDDRHGEREAGAVKQRRRRQIAVVRAVAAVFRGHAVEGQDAGAVRQHHALGLAGRPGGVGNREGRPFGQRRRPQGPGLGEQGVVLLAQNDDPLDAVQRQAADGLGQIGMDEQDARAAVVADIADLAADQPGVERRHRHAGAGGARDDLDILQAVGRQDRGVVARPEAEPVGHHRAHPVDPVDQRGVGQRPGALAESDFLRRALGRGAHAGRDGERPVGGGRRLRRCRGHDAASGAVTRPPARPLPARPPPIPAAGRRAAHSPASARAGFPGAGPARRFRPPRAPDR